MNQTASNYGQALYDLARNEAISEAILSQLLALQTGIEAEPAYIRLLNTPTLSKQERCRILDDSFGGKVHPYVLNFLKILTEQGAMRHFCDCCRIFETLYNRDHGILVVTVVSSVALTEQQQTRLKEKLTSITGKQIQLRCRIDAAVLGGIRLDYDGKQMDDTLSARLEAMGKLLKNTVL